MDWVQKRGRDTAYPHADSPGACHETADSHHQELVRYTRPALWLVEQQRLRCNLHVLARLAACKTVGDVCSGVINAARSPHAQSFLGAPFLLRESRFEMVLSG